ACFPGFASRYPARKFAAAAALGVVVVYLFLSGAGVATKRASIMLGVMLIAVMLDRPSITMRNLAVAALILLVIAPHEIADPGFQMSFAATAALIAVYGKWAERRTARLAVNALRRPEGIGALFRTVLSAIVALAVTSLVAGAATGIYGVWHFYRAAPLGLFANLAAMPIVSFAVMPSALLSVVLI